MEGHLTPRVTACLPIREPLRTTLSVWLIGLDLVSIMKLSTWFDSPEDFVSELPDDLRTESIAAAAFFEKVEKLAAAAVFGSARADMTGEHPPQLWPARRSSEHVQDGIGLALPTSLLPQRRTHKRARRMETAELTTAKSVEAKHLEDALDLAFSLGQTIAKWSPRMISFSTRAISVDDQKALLRPVFLRRASAVATLKTNVRTTLKFLAWAETLNLDLSKICAEHIALYLRDAAGRGPSVPKSIWSSLDWAREVFDFQWPLSDRLVEAQRHSSSLQAEAACEQAPPLTREIMDHMLDGFFMAVDAKDVNGIIYIGFVIVLAFACLRWSDLQRSCNINFSRDSFFGESWKSKKKVARMPWAAPRRDWKGRDWASPFYAYLQTLLDLASADFVVPVPVRRGVVLEIEWPIRPSSYAAALNTFRSILRVQRSVGDAMVWSLHSPRSFLPSLAGQMRFSLEERRTLGRWGPASGMPVRYDRARCVTELLIKHDIMSQLKNGFQPAGSFELPSQTDVDQQVAAINERRQSKVRVPEQTASEIATEPPRAVSADKPSAEGTPGVLRDGMSFNDARELVLNTTSMMLHIRDESDPGKARCPFVWSQSRSGVEPATGRRSDYPEYSLCGGCWGRNTALLDLPQWVGDIDEDALEVPSEESDESSTSSSCR